MKGYANVSFYTQQRISVIACMMNIAIKYNLLTRDGFNVVIPFHTFGKDHSHFTFLPTLNFLSQLDRKYNISLRISNPVHLLMYTFLIYNTLYKNTEAVNNSKIKNNLK